MISDTARIRNFSIIAHIDHGKSTLADRFLELTGTVERRKMRDQVLDSMDLERERGITIKMQPVRMRHAHKGEEYVLNLIDTPGHIDFSYEVSRALSAVEGAILLVDATQGVQAQTLSVLALARELGLVIVPVVSKIDSPLARTEAVVGELASLLGVSAAHVCVSSGKTGEGVAEVLSAVVERIPPPRASSGRPEDFRGLVFDFTYSNHRGVVVYLRVVDGSVARGDRLSFRAAGKSFTASDVGVLTPEEVPAEALHPGEIGYVATGLKEPGVVAVGDTLARERSALPSLPGYREPLPVVWASLFPEGQEGFPLLRSALEKLRLSDSALSFEEESSGILGKGFRCGFLGMLHLEIVTERLKREFGLAPVVTAPSISYDLELKGGKRETVRAPSRFPDPGTTVSVKEPWVAVTLIAPVSSLGALVELLYEHEAEVGASESFGDGRTKVSAAMPLRELMRGFFDRIKSVSSGYASLSYEPAGERPADVVRLDLLVAEEVVPAFTRIVARRRVREEARRLVEALAAILPRQLFATKIQARADGRIIASETLPALRKDVTGYLYGGDVTRKKKLLEKQKRGKKKLRLRGRVNIPPEVFLKMVRAESASPKR